MNSWKHKSQESAFVLLTNSLDLCKNRLHTIYELAVNPKNKTNKKHKFSIFDLSVLFHSALLKKQKQNFT